MTGAQSGPTQLAGLDVSNEWDDNLLVKTFVIPRSTMKQTLDIIEPPSEKSTRETPGYELSDHISFTQLAMYMRCSMQYYFRYVEHMKEKPKVSLSIGKGGHEALEWNSRKKIVNGTDAPVEELLQRASDAMDYYMAEMPASEYEKDTEPGALKDKQIAATKVYRLRDAPAVNPIGVEVNYSLDLNKYLPDSMRELVVIRPVDLKIDLLYQDKQTKVVPTKGRVAIGVEDYKYTTRKKPQAEVDLSPQLTLYTTAVKDISGDWPTKSGFRLMHPGSLAKKPRSTDDGPNSIPMYRGPELMTEGALEARMTRIAYQFAQAERGIREGIFIPVDEPTTCSWCGFRERCQGTSTNDFDAAMIREKTTPPIDSE